MLIRSEKVRIKVLPSRSPVRKGCGAPRGHEMSNAQLALHELCCRDCSILFKLALCSLLRVQVPGSPQGWPRAMARYALRVVTVVAL